MAAEAVVAVTVVDEADLEGVLPAKADLAEGCRVVAVQHPIRK